MNCYFIITLILTSVFGLFSLIRHFQMFQQNSYFPSRYTTWLKQNFSYINIFLFFISSVLFLLKLYLIQLIFTAIILIFEIYSAIKIQKKAIKKIVFTARIKRLFVTAAIIYAIPIIVHSLFSQSPVGKILAVISLVLSFVSPILIYMCWAVTLPIEKSISRWYINDAKKILKNHKDLKVIGITGSYGKTTTKFILNRILSEKFNTVCTPQSFNTPMGVVRTIRELIKPQTEIFICEMGAKNIGDIKEICDIVDPDYALITSVGPQHLETFKTIENIYNTKFELFDAVSKKNGDVFVNGDSKEIIARVKDKKLNIYGTNREFAYKAENITYGRNGSSFDLCIKEQKIPLTTRLLGIHSITNIVGAAALSYSLGVSAEEIKYAVSCLKATEHRLEIKSSVAGSVMIDDAYNSNPEGCLEAVRVLGTFNGMKKVIITPGLIELGEKEYEANYNLGLEAANICDIIILVGKNRSKPISEAINSTAFNKENLFVVSSFMEAMKIYSGIADSNTAVLLENDLPDNYLN